MALPIVEPEKDEPDIIQGPFDESAYEAQAEPDPPEKQ